MNFDQADLKDLEVTIADQLYMQIASWNLYLGDAGLAKSLAIECMAHLEEGPSIAAEKALETIQVSIAGGKTKLSLGQLMPAGQVHDLIELINPYCR